MTAEEIDVEHLAELREAAQKAYAWQEYVGDWGLEEHEPGRATRDYEQSMLALESALERHGLRVSEDLNAPGDEWFESLSPVASGEQWAAADPSQWSREFLAPEQASRHDGHDRSR